MKRIRIEIDENERDPGYRDYLREEFERVLDKVLAPEAQPQSTSAIEKSLPKLTCDTYETNVEGELRSFWLIGEKPVTEFGYDYSEAFESDLEKMPPKTDEEAHEFLCGLVGFEWDTQYALERFSDTFRKNKDGTWQGSHYKTEKQLADETMKREAEAEREKDENYRAFKAEVKGLLHSHVKPHEIRRQQLFNRLYFKEHLPCSAENAKAVLELGLKYRQLITIAETGLAGRQLHLDTAPLSGDEIIGIDAAKELCWEWCVVKNGVEPDFCKCSSGI